MLSPDIITDIVSDEVFKEEFNLHNNSVGVPIDPNASTSSNESNNNTTVKDCDGFAIPRLPKGSRRWHTTPGGTRHRSVMRTPAESPTGTRRKT